MGFNITTNPLDKNPVCAFVTRILNKKSNTRTMQLLIMYFLACHACITVLSGYLMVLILDGNSEIGTHVRRNLWYFIYLGYWEQSQIGFSFSIIEVYFLHTCATCSDLPSNVSTMRYLYKHRFIHRLTPFHPSA